MLRLDQNTTVRLVDLTEKPEQRSIIQLLAGALQSLSRAPRKLAVNTPYINGMIEGTEFLTRVEQGRADITVFEGKVIAENELGSLPLTPGESAEAEQGRAPQPRVIVHPRDAVHWALYYPPILNLSAETFAADPMQNKLAASLQAYEQGDLQQAFDQLSSVPETAHDARFLAYRASLYLTVGRVEKALADIDRMLRLNPNDANALALQAIIKVVQDQSDQALKIAQHALQFAPDSPAALLALSYAQQAMFNLEGARQSIEKVVSLEPTNALGWARLAELHASFGELDAALTAAQKAVELKPNLSRTQSVLGFSQLMQVNTAQAKASFHKAIIFSSSDPLPRLGLGLAKIREGELAEGRREIEIAAGLDPNNAIVRSYLGKSYFEEKRTALTDREYQTAKELDANDPTPYFYDAIEKQTTNRPVEALQDIQKAIELNDNRAVYRSRLLLDADLAARSASLARVYSDLGFQELALREGWKSVSTDPTNFSAHRFLADSYSVLPRHEIARVSELLQSQLMQPLSMTPIQPRLGESNLFLVSAGGPGALSFNEFNPLFNRDGLSVQANSVIGEHDTYSGEGIVSGIFDKAAFSLGGFHYTTNGYRENAQQKDNIANAFFQYELSTKTSLQAEYRYRDAEIGDLQMRFFPDEYYPGQKTPQERHSYRLGARHSFSDNSILLGSLSYTRAQFGAYDNAPFISPGFITALNLREPQEAFGSEMQHLFRSTYFDLISGVGYFDRNSQAYLNANTVLPPPENIMHFPDQDTDLKHVNAYGYSNIKPSKNLTLTLGVSGDFTGGDVRDSKDMDQINPKIGVTWTPFRDTTWRAAWFRSLKRSLINNQTLEPTQVAGFNQFFDDFNGTRAWRYGTGIDQRFSKTVFGGVEVSRRDLDVPASDQFGEPIRIDWKEELARTYLFWTPHPWLSLRGEYHYELIKRDENIDRRSEKYGYPSYSIGNQFFPSIGFGCFGKSDLYQPGRRI